LVRAPPGLKKRPWPTKRNVKALAMGRTPSSLFFRGPARPEKPRKTAQRKEKKFAAKVWTLSRTTKVHRVRPYRRYEDGGDVLLLCTPPTSSAHCNLEGRQLKAGKRHQCSREKPVAVDAPGVRSVILEFGAGGSEREETCRWSLSGLCLASNSGLPRGTVLENAFTGRKIGDVSHGLFGQRTISRWQVGERRIFPLRQTGKLGPT